MATQLKVSYRPNLKDDQERNRKMTKSIFFPNRPIPSTRRLHFHRRHLQSELNTCISRRYEIFQKWQIRAEKIYRCHLLTWNGSYTKNLVIFKHFGKYLLKFPWNLIVNLPIKDRKYWSFKAKPAVVFLLYRIFSAPSDWWCLQLDNCRMMKNFRWIPTNVISNLMFVNYKRRNTDGILVVYFVFSKKCAILTALLIAYECVYNAINGDELAESKRWCKLTCRTAEEATDETLCQHSSRCGTPQCRWEELSGRKCKGICRLKEKANKWQTHQAFMSTSSYTYKL